MDVTGEGSKVQCCKEQYRIEIWNVRSMNQGKLEVVKQELARMNINILGISELKWAGMGELNSDDHYIYYCGSEIKLPRSVGSSKKQESSRKTSVSDLLTMPKPLTVWITINCGKF